MQILVNGSVLVPSTDGVSKFKWESAETVNLEEIENLMNNRIEEIKEQTPNYYFESIESYCKYLENNKHRFQTETWNLLFYITNEYLFLFSYNDSTDVVLNNLIYKFENEYYSNILKEIYRINDNNFRNVEYLELPFIENSTTKRKTMLLVEPNIVEIIAKCKLLDAQHTPIYRHFTKRFPNGKVRELDEPNEIIQQPLKTLNQVLNRVYGKINKECQFAYKKGTSIVNNALPHKNNHYVFKADIEDFFPSCKRELVKKYVKFLFKSSLTSESLLDYFLNKMLVNNALCLGNPISPVIANTIISKPAKYIYNMCNRTGIAFTQYCDDLTFSSSRPISKDYVVRIFNEAYTTYNLRQYFRIKERKLIGQVGQYRNVTGVAFDHTRNNEPTCKRSLYRNLRTSIHKMALGEQVNERKIKGQIAYMVMLGKGQRILNYVNKFDGLTERLFSQNLLNKINNTHQEFEIDFTNLD